MRPSTPDSSRGTARSCPEGMVGAAAPPVDVSTTGSSAAAGPTGANAPPEPSMASKLGDVALGAVEGIGLLAVGAAKAA